MNAGSCLHFLNLATRFRLLFRTFTICLFSFKFSKTFVCAALILLTICPLSSIKTVKTRIFPLNNTEKMELHVCCLFVVSGLDLRKKPLLWGRYFGKQQLKKRKTMLSKMKNNENQCSVSFSTYYRTGAKRHRFYSEHFFQLSW